MNEILPCAYVRPDGAVVTISDDSPALAKKVSRPSGTTSAPDRRARTPPVWEPTRGLGWDHAERGREPHAQHCQPVSARAACGFRPGGLPAAWMTAGVQPSSVKSPPGVSSRQRHQTTMLQNQVSVPEVGPWRLMPCSRSHQREAATTPSGTRPGRSEINVVSHRQVVKVMQAGSASARGIVMTLGRQQRLTRCSSAPVQRSGSSDGAGRLPIGQRTSATSDRSKPPARPRHVPPSRHDGQPQSAIETCATPTPAVPSNTCCRKGLDNRGRQRQHSRRK